MLYCAILMQLTSVEVRETDGKKWKIVRISQSAQRRAVKIEVDAAKTQACIPSNII